MFRMIAAVSRRNLMAMLCAGSTLGVMGFPKAAPACDRALLRVGVDAFPQTLNPLEVRDLVASRVLAAMYEGLTRIDHNGQVQAALAERWEPADNGRLWRFHLRPGVRFHTGRTFTARDVKKTFEALLENPAAPSFAAPGLKKVLGHDDMVRNKGSELRGIEVIDEHTVDVRFSDPCAIFPFFKFLIVDVDFVKAHGPDWFMKGSAGTGPYRFSTWQPGVRVDLTSHDEWWDDGPAHGKVSFVVAGGREASIAAFNNNDADFVLIDADLVRKTIEGSGFRRSLISCPRMQTRSIALLQDRYTPFRDKRVRLAMSMMIDREAVAERFFRGMAVVHNGLVPPLLLSDAGHQPLAYDPAGAERLLAEAGYPRGGGMPPLAVSTLPEFRQEFAYYVSQWSNVGIPATLNVVPKNEFNTKSKKGEYAAYHMGWTAAYPDAMNFLGDLFGGDSPFNQIGWRSADFDRLIGQANAVTDPTARANLYRMAERLVLDDFPVLPLVVPDYVALRCSPIADRYLSPFGGLVVR
jgi:oligopeptide transport system substrate-binding protein